MAVATTLSEDKKEFFQILYKNAFFREKIILSSGQESDYYIDARRVTLSATGAYFSAKIILQLVKEDKFSAIGGPTLGADPLVGAIGVLSHQAGKPVNTFIIRKAPKPHGKQQQIEGPIIPEGSQVILIDDVATTGKAFVESIEVLKKYHIGVAKAICLVDREQGAQKALAKYKVPLVTIFKATEFLNSKS
ncbi:MAG: orotate phosphoribosyltransferase [Omnitrophica WOR_2 bacterium RIFCSPHIGHO2_01_FULL_48_9]|nr:MAG: orotate phosphoribosyltransferase [Omnitrophica WOR_2 bacterium RIFCSPHIGHO2_01_FULL_48_9]